MPIYVQGYRVFTNGVIMLVESFEGDASHIEVRPKLSDLLEKASEQAYQQLSISWPEAETVYCTACSGSGRGTELCPECNGEGEVNAETDYNTYEVTCKSCCGKGRSLAEDRKKRCEACDGAGKRFDDYQPVVCCGISVPLQQLKMLKDVADMEFAACTEKACLFWRSESEQCFGAISALKY